VDALPRLRLLAPVHGRVTRRTEVALQVHGDDRVPLGLGHVDDHAVAQDPGVVHEHVQVAELVDGLLHQSLRAVPVGHVLAVHDRFAAHRLDVVNGLLPRAEVGTLDFGSGSCAVTTSPGRTCPLESNANPTSPSFALASSTVRPSTSGTVAMIGPRETWICTVDWYGAG